MNWEDFEMNEWIVQTCEELGFKEPTPIQQNTIPHILNGQDIVGCAETGSGKTAAFALPILHDLSQEPYGVFCLVLTPTRELAMQITEQFQAFGARINVNVLTVTGGLDMTKQAIQLSRIPHIIVATPGRLADHINKNIDLHNIFKKTKYLVLDEADRMLDQTFAESMGTIMGVLPTEKRQTLLYSATLSRDLQDLLEHDKVTKSNKIHHFHQSDSIDFETVKTLTQQCMITPYKVRECYLVYLLRSYPDDSIIIFTPTCEVCEQINWMLRELEIKSTSLHSWLDQKTRSSSLQKFKASLVNVLVCTDVAARGLDIPSVSLVINYNVPRSVKDYVHRVGRTARKGRKGKAISLCTQYDTELVKSIEKDIEKELTILEPSEDDVLYHLNESLSAMKIAQLKLEEVGFGEKQKKRKAKNSNLQNNNNNNNYKNDNKKQNDDKKKSMVKQPKKKQKIEKEK